VLEDSPIALCPKNRDRGGQRIKAGVALCLEAAATFWKESPLARLAPTTMRERPRRLRRGGRGPQNEDSLATAESGRLILADVRRPAERDFVPILAVVLCCILCDDWSSAVVASLPHLSLICAHRNIHASSDRLTFFCSLLGLLEQ